MRSIALLALLCAAAPLTACLDVPDPPTLVDPDDADGVEADASDVTTSTPDSDSADAPYDGGDGDAAPDADADADADAAPPSCETDGDCPAPGPCREDGVCNLEHGACVYLPSPDGTNCDDEDPCTEGDACSEGVCVGEPKDCGEPGEPCLDGACDPETGECSASPREEDTPCDDGDPCTEDDACSGGVCEGIPKDCDDGVACTEDTCGADGTCVHDASDCECSEDAHCADDTLCNGEERCVDYACVAGEPVDCTDLHGACVEGACDPDTGACSAVPLKDGIPCDDQDACTLDDACSEGVCEGTPKDCDDGVACTEDSCLPDGSCLYDTAGCGCAVHADCDDENPCTGEERCEDFTCVPGEATDCSHLDAPCLEGVCKPTDGECTTSVLPLDTPCDDGDPCTVDDVCDGGNCEGTPDPCDDGNPCTADSCDPDTGDCLHAPLDDGTPCDDGDPCTTADTCNDGECLALEAVELTEEWVSIVSGMDLLSDEARVDSASEYSTYGGFEFSKESAVEDATGEHQVLSPIGGSDLALTRFDDDGGFEWIRHIRSDGVDRLDHLLALPDGGLVAALVHGKSVEFPGGTSLMGPSAAGNGLVRYAAGGDPDWYLGMNAFDVQAVFRQSDGFGVLACVSSSATVPTTEGEAGPILPAPKPGTRDCYGLKWSPEGATVGEPNHILSTTGKVSDPHVTTGFEALYLSTEVLVSWTIDSSATLKVDQDSFSPPEDAGEVVVLLRLNGDGEPVRGAFLYAEEPKIWGGEAAYARTARRAVVAVGGDSLITITRLDGEAIGSLELVPDPQSGGSSYCIVGIDMEDSEHLFTRCNVSRAAVPVASSPDGSLIWAAHVQEQTVTDASGHVFSVAGPGRMQYIGFDPDGNATVAAATVLSPFAFDRKIQMPDTMLSAELDGEFGDVSFVGNGDVRIVERSLRPPDGCTE